ncbi:hypothetical protein U737_23685 [Methylomonas sp. LW13]|uniref:hypothetical protein n=1 Tax=unclassified Methylomonas TaxID=2608980 RepID=UPI00051AD28E|nr:MULTISPECIES: hypothetical protein [unclassified Methylomonas]PKD40275.1 hypothetical protein CWO84_11835 [Methylomonas sp. Kb3]QBC29677.1 hypothetical protein U737_23685 [Methylomonas sp. LW13]
MIESPITSYLKYMRLQVVAEAFLTDEFGNLLTPGMPQGEYEKALINGNTHTSKLTTTEIEAFKADWTVLAQQANTDTGFSGTLFKSTDGEYVISFRSTEFVDDNIRDSFGTNNSISDYGWAFGQISDMMKWFQGLNLPAGAHVTLTGYSLGGHLATAFTMLVQERNLPITIDHAYLFNSAGTGGLNNGASLSQVIQTFDQLWQDGHPDNAVLAEKIGLRADLYARALTAADNGIQDVLNSVKRIGRDVWRFVNSPHPTLAFVGICDWHS